MIVLISLPLKPDLKGSDFAMMGPHTTLWEEHQRRCGRLKTSSKLGRWADDADLR